MKHVIQRQVTLLRDRSVNTLLVCSLYAVAKLAKAELTFKQILDAFARLFPEDIGRVTHHVSLRAEGSLDARRGSIIDFYNTVFVAANNDYLVSIKRNILRETLAVAFTRVSKPRPQSSPRRLLPLLPPRASPCRRASSRRQNRPSTACGRASTPPARPPSGWLCHLM